MSTIKEIETGDIVRLTEKSLGKDMKVGRGVDSGGDIYIGGYYMPAVAFKLVAKKPKGPQPDVTNIGEHTLRYDRDGSNVRVGCFNVTRRQVEDIQEHMEALYEYDGSENLFD